MISYFSMDRMVPVPGIGIGEAGYSMLSGGENIAAGYSTVLSVIEGWLIRPVLLKMNQRMHAVLGEPFTTLQFIQFNDKGTGGNLSAQSFDEPAARGSGSTGG